MASRVPKRLFLLDINWVLPSANDVTITPSFLRVTILKSPGIPVIDTTSDKSIFNFFRNANIEISLNGLRHTWQLGWLKTIFVNYQARKEAQQKWTLN